MAGSREYPCSPHEKLLEFLQYCKTFFKGKYEANWNFYRSGGRGSKEKPSREKRGRLFLEEHIVL